MLQTSTGFADQRGWISRLSRGQTAASPTYGHTAATLHDIVGPLQSQRRSRSRILVGPSAVKVQSRVDSDCPKEGTEIAQHAQPENREEHHYGEII